MNRRIIVVGGGASGLMAALAAAMEGAEVTLLEHMDRVGKKILATGNGRCNLTNLAMKPEFYRCSQESFPMQILDRYSVWDTLSFFGELGIVTKNKNGYIYPNSEQASAVVDTLRIEAGRCGIRLCCKVHVLELKIKNKRVAVQTEQGGLEADAVILATGSKAAPGTGSDGSGYEIARRLGHHVIKPLPALVQLKCRGKQYQAMAGVRCEARLTLEADGIIEAEDEGELQLTDYGISGIPTFQISRYAAVSLDQQKKVTVLINFLPSKTPAECAAFLSDRVRRFHYRPCGELLLGVLNQKLALALLKQAGIRPNMKVLNLTEEQSDRLISALTAYPASVTETNSFAQAQVCCGGVDTTEICPETMESRLAKNVYFAGELLDVDGICGGYNLQWAWSTGMIAGMCAGRGAYDSNQSNKNAAGTHGGAVKTKNRKNPAAQRGRT